MLVADNGSDWFISGRAVERLGQRRAAMRCKRVQGSDFEVVDTSKLPRP